MIAARFTSTTASAIALVSVFTFGSVSAAIANDQVVEADPILRTRRSIVVSRSCATIWPFLADFSGIGKWYNAFRSVRHFSGPVNRVGEVREIVRASNGQLVREKLIYLDPASYELGYTHVLNPPVRDNVTLVSLMALPQGQCQVTWSNTYRLKPGQNPSEPPAFFVKAYSNVLDGLKQYVESQTPVTEGSP